MSDHLLRRLAPITDVGWAGIEADVRPKLAVQLAARRLVDFTGPSGWDTSAASIGHVDEIPAPEREIGAHLRRVLPLVELRIDFALSRRDLADFDRGARDVDLDALDEAARILARAENRALFHGYAASGIRGLVEASSHPPIVLESNPDRTARGVAHAVDQLRTAGIDGPFALALDPTLHTAIIEGSEHGGYPVFEHLAEILGGPVVWAPGLEGGAVISQRGGDYTFESGQDISIGYAGHDDQLVRLYLEESFTFRVDEDGAAVPLQGPGS